MSTVLAQFSPQGFLDGMEGIVKLVEGSPYLQVCLINIMVDVPAALQQDYCHLSTRFRSGFAPCETALCCCALCVFDL